MADTVIPFRPAPGAHPRGTPPDKGPGHDPVEVVLGRAALPPLLAAFAAAAADPATPYPLVRDRALDVLRVSAACAARLGPYEAREEFKKSIEIYCDALEGYQGTTDDHFWHVPDALLRPILIAQRELGLPFDGALNRRLRAVLDLGLLRFLVVEPDIHTVAFWDACEGFSDAFGAEDPAAAVAAVDRLGDLLGVVPHDHTYPHAPDAALWAHFALDRHLACLPGQGVCGGYDEQIAQLEARRGTLRGCGAWDAEREVWLENRLARLRYRRDREHRAPTAPHAPPAGGVQLHRDAVQDA